MNDDTEDFIDVLLREQFEGPVLNEGFCDRVMDRLPARRRRNKWPLIVGTLAGVATCWFSMWSAPIAYIGWRDWQSGELSESAIALFAAMMGMSILALAWTIAESDEQCGQSGWRIIR